MNEQEIFAAALEQEAHRRATFLDEACGADAELRQRIEKLLRCHDQAGAFFEKPAAEIVGTAQLPPITETTGTQIGPYKLLQQIGEGGMGVVYLAEQQEPVRRTVALKIIKPGMDTRQVIARFEAERQALSLMDHPNIAKVLDAGTTDSGRPYFVMELVKGQPITQYCDEKHLTPRQRLELLLPVCQAIQHAHQKGIIHRDIKPTNILVAEYDQQPVPKVIDFGVAKAISQTLTEQTAFTGYGQLVGTLEYMSPEQAKVNQLDIDTRSDIYSLGVLLYELLTGTTPFDRQRLRSAAWDEMLRIIREEEPQRPSTKLSTIDTLASVAANRQTAPARLTGLVRGELDWIVMKALEKDRARRYETASALAADLQHYLNDEPVIACPPSAGYRVKKFLKRNKGPVAAVAVVVLALVGGILGTTWGLVRAEKARRDAVTAQLAESKRAAGERQAKQEALAATEAETKAKVTAEAREAETRAVLEFVENRVFAAARPEGQEGGLGRDVMLRQAVEAALPFVEDSFKDQPLIEARLRWTIGGSFFFLGDAGQAAEQYERARALYTQHRGPDHADTLGITLSVATAYAALGRQAEALKLREETLALQKTKLGPENPATLLGIQGLANSYHAVGRHAEALNLREETLALQTAKLGPEHADTLLSAMNLAISYKVLGRRDDALKLYEKTLARLKKTLGPEHPTTLMTINNLALAYLAYGRAEDARRLFEETLAIEKAKLGPDHPTTLATMNNLADVYHSLFGHAPALALNEEVLARRKAKLGPGHPHTLESLDKVAVCYTHSGRHAEALKLNEEALALKEARIGPDDPDTLASMGRVAICLFQLDRGAEGARIMDECLKRAATKSVPPNNLSVMFNNHARFLKETNDSAGLRTLAERVEKLKPAGAGLLYDLACVRAILAAVPRANDKSQTAQDSAADADQAIVWLKQAVAAGFTDAEHMKKDGDLDALREREDFQKLLADLNVDKEKQKK